jgi:hypothetical protein
MDIPVILAYVGAAAATFLGGKFLVKVDSKREDRAEEAIDLAAWCQGNGLPGVAILLKKFAIKDYSGAFTQFRQIAATVRDEQSSKEAVRTFLQVQLDKYLANPTTAEELLRLIEDRLGVKIDRDAVATKTVELGKVE